MGNDFLEKMKQDPSLGRKLLKQMLLIRRFEERAAKEYSSEKIRGFLHLYVGEEAIAVGILHFLSSEDYLLTTYREHGHALARGISSKAVMAEMFGKLEGCSKGRGGSMHLFDASLNFFGGNAIVGGHLPLAVGMALASKKLKRQNITCCFFGEGAAAEGEFYESLNLAVLWQVPVLFVCENNLYAMGTNIKFTHSIPELEKKGKAFGIESVTVDGMDLIKVMEAAEKAVQFIRNTGKPYFLVCDTYRFRAHSMFDAELYREKSEVEKWKKRDPIPNFRNYLVKGRLISEQELSEIEREVTEEIDQAVAFAENGTWEEVSNLTQFVYSDSQEA